MSVDLKYPPWQRDRSFASHDWLQNRFLVVLGKWENVCDGQVEDEEFERTVVERELTVWADRRSQLAQLIERFEGEMSPVQVLNDPPLSACDTDTKEWLGELIHEAWLEQVAVPALVKTATDALAGADAAFESLQDLRGDGLRGEELGDGVHAFRKSCEQLARAISRFPSEILIA